MGENITRGQLATRGGLLKQKKKREISLAEKRIWTKEKRGSSDQPEKTSAWDSMQYRPPESGEGKAGE